MKGDMEYELKYQRRINNIIKSNSNLEGVYAFMRDKTISTIYNYLIIINKFLLFIEDKKVEDLSIDDFSRYLLKIQQNKNGEKTTSSYKIDVYSALKIYGEYLVASGQLKNNPMNRIKRPKAIESKKTIEKRKVGFLSEKEIPQYISSVKEGVGTDRSKSRQKNWRERDLAITMLFLNTGIRCSALMKMDVDSIDFENGILVVTDKEENVNEYELNSDILNIIDQWILKRNEILDGKESEALFISNRRSRMDQKSIQRVVKKYAENIKGKHITPHKLRATYATQLYGQTRDIYFVQGCMKHSNPKTTELYIRGMENQTGKASDIMATLTVDKNKIKTEN